MEIKYRLVDVETLICYACQDYLSLIIKDKWQEELRKRAKEAVENGNLEDRPDKYVNVYENMKDIKDFNVRYMDVTIIEIIWHCDSLLIGTVNNSTKHKLSDLASDKNIYSHSHWHESSDELFDRGIVSLDLLKKFVQTVEKKETIIDSEERIKYRDEYMQKIKDLKKTLFEDIRPITDNNTVPPKTTPEHKSSRSKNTELLENQTITKSIDSISYTTKTSRAATKDNKKKDLTVGGVSGSRKMRLGRVHKKKTDS